jgi:hypothetical protein
MEPMRENLFRDEPRGGSAEDLVKWLIDRNQNPETADKFLAAFPQVINADFIWKIAESRYREWAKANKDKVAKVEENYIGPRDRAGQFLWRWIDRDFSRDFLSKNSNMFDPLMKLIEDVTNMKLANEYKLLMIRAAANTKKRTHRRLRLQSTRLDGSVSSGDLTPDDQGNSNQSSPSGTIAVRPPVARPTLVNTPPVPRPLDVGLRLGAPMRIETRALEEGRFELLDLDDRDVAEQLTLIEFHIFVRIMNSEFHKLNWKNTNKKAGVNVNTMVERFNTVSYWVASEIVVQTDLKRRLALIKKFIGIAEQMREIGNFNGLMEIIGGLNSMAVTRLKATWEQVPKPLVELLASLNQLMDHVGNYLSYRNALKSVKLPALPYLGVYLRDIIFLDEGNPDYFDKEKQIINFEKLQLLGTTFCDIRKFQRIGFPFQKNRVMESFLLQLKVLPEEMLYKHSLLCENNPGNEDSA